MEGVDASVSVKRTAAKVAAVPASVGAPYAQLRDMPAALSGSKLQLAVGLLESSFGPYAFQFYTGRQPGMRRVHELLRSEGLEDAPRPTSLHSSSWSPEPLQVDELPAADAHTRLDEAVHCVQRGGHMAGVTKCSTASNARPTVLDYHFAYTHGMATPSLVAERVIKFLEAHNAKQHWLSAWSAQDIRANAAAATERYAAGRPLSVLDGVPFVVKDCIDALPYPTSYGTSFMGDLHRATADAPCVTALKELGAVLLGKGAMNEFGVFAHGHNGAHAGTTLNPHCYTKTAGGSSSGCAAAVAVGLCPIAVGADGGGSIRIPSSLCGVVGLKTTKGRLADDHGAHAGYSSLIVSGPIANCVADLTLLYAVMGNTNYAGADTRKPGAAALALPGVEAAAAEAAAAAPKPLQLPRVLLQLPEESEHSLDQVELAELKPLQGLRVGVFSQWANDCTPAVAEVLKANLARLEKLGATRVDITLPDMELVQVAHMATWAKEMDGDADAQGWLQDWSLRRQLNLDTRMFHAMASNFTGQDYEQAQRMRARVLKHFERALDKCDVILTPATPSAATELPAGHNTTGVFDTEATLQMVRFTQAANLTGLPALVMPGGRQLTGFLPVGLQLMAQPYGEATLLRVAAALEQQLMEDGLPKPVPSLLVNPIECEMGAHPLAREMTKKLWSKKYGRAAAGGH